MIKIRAAVRALSLTAAYAAAVILALMVSLVAIEIAMRSIFHSSLYFVEEMVGYGVAASTFLALPYTFLTGGHIRVTVVLDKLSGGIRRGLEIVASLSALCVTGFIGWYLFKRIHLNWVREATSSGVIEVPLWLPQAITCVGLVILFICFLMHFILSIRGDTAIVNTEHTSVSEKGYE